MSVGLPARCRFGGIRRVVRCEYAGVERVGSVGLRKDGESVWVYSLKARTKGGGRAVMTALAAACDEHRVEMMLVPSPYCANKGIRAKRKKELVAFYEDFGFHFTGDGVMVRKPTGA